MKCLAYVYHAVKIHAYGSLWQFGPNLSEFHIGDTESMKKVHWVAWKDLYQPKENEDIGLRLERHVNDSFMIKVAWELCMKPSHLWVKVVRAKYACRDDHWHIIEKKKRGSNLWSSIKYVWDAFQENCVVNGMNVAWRSSSYRNFKVKNVYHCVANLENSPNTMLFRIIWRWEGAKRSRVLLWKMAKGALATNEARREMGFTESWSCPMCENEKETTFHCMRDFQHA